MKPAVMSHTETKATNNHLHMHINVKLKFPLTPNNRLVLPCEEFKASDLESFKLKHKSLFIMKLPWESNNVIPQVLQVTYSMSSAYTLGLHFRVQCKCVVPEGSFCRNPPKEISLMAWNVICEYPSIFETSVIEAFIYDHITPYIHSTWSR